MNVWKKAKTSAQAALATVSLSVMQHLHRGESDLSSGHARLCVELVHRVRRNRCTNQLNQSTKTMADSNLEHDITIDGTGDRATYEFSTTGKINPVTVNAHEQIDEKHVAGFVGGWKDEYEFNGDIIDFEIDGEAELTLDGETVPHELLPMSRIDIHAPHDRGYYKFAASGKTIRTADEPVDEVFDGGEQVRGTAGKGGHEAYRFQGVLQGFKCTENMDVWVDGQSKGTIEGAPFGEAPGRWD